MLNKRLHNFVPLNAGKLSVAIDIRFRAPDFSAPASTRWGAAARLAAGSLVPLARLRLLCAILTGAIYAVAFPAAWAYSGPDYYVASTGSDSNDGSARSPFATIKRAASVVEAGGTVYVKDGIYPQSIWLKRSGAPGAWIRFQSVNRYGAKVVPHASGNGNDAFNINTRNYIEISGFEITAGAQSQGVTAGYGGTAGHIRVINNLIHDCGASGIQLNNADYIDVEGNTVYHNALLAPWSGSGISIYEPVPADTGPGFHIIVRNNIVYRNDNASGGTDGNGIIMDDFRHSQGSGVAYTPAALVENNLCFGNGGAGIQVYYSNNLTVRNNTVYFNRQRADSSTLRGELGNIKGANNIWVNNITWADPSVDLANTAILDAGKGNIGVIWANNLTFDGTPQESSVEVTDGSPSTVTAELGNLLGRDPLFVNPGTSDTADFHLRTGSPAIGTGSVNYGVPPDDLDGRPRNANSVDLGAYAREASP